MSASQLNQDLRALRARLVDPKSWVKGTAWETDPKTGKVIGECLGSHLCSLKLPLDGRQEAVKMALIGSTDISKIVRFNDAEETTHADVLKKIDDAIAANP